MIELKTTKDYGLFKIRDDNRADIKRKDIERIKASMRIKNMLPTKPIDVNGNMEIIDGNHRYMAARELGLEITYRLDKTLKATDILLLNISRSWGREDYMNFYVKHGYEQYILLKEFMDREGVSLNVALNLNDGRGGRLVQLFKDGKFVFKLAERSTMIKNCWDTINYIKKMNGSMNTTFASSVRFWKALIKFVTHADFDEKKWQVNLERMVGRITAKVSHEEYYAMLIEIYNYRNNNKISVVDYGQ